jgi:hypothetical protein
VRKLVAAASVERPADYKSAIQQITNLRYANAGNSASIGSGIQASRHFVRALAAASWYGLAHE